MFESKDISFKVSFGDKDYGLFYEVDVMLMDTRTTRNFGNYLNSLGYEPVRDKMGIRNIEFMSRELSVYKNSIKLLLSDF